MFPLSVFLKVANATLIFFFSFKRLQCTLHFMKGNKELITGCKKVRKRQTTAWVLFRGSKVSTLSYRTCWNSIGLYEFAWGNKAVFWLVRCINTLLLHYIQHSGEQGPWGCPEDVANLDKPMQHAAHTVQPQTDLVFTSISSKYLHLSEQSGSII